MSRNFRLGKWPVFALCLVLCSCQSTFGPEQEKQIDQQLKAGHFDQAAQQHAEYQAHYKPQDELLYHLNQSSLDYYNSLYQARLSSDWTREVQSSPAFERAEDMLRLKDAQQASFVEQAGSNAHKAYTASLQTSLWHNAFASLYYWNRNSLDGALVELRRSHQKVEIYQQYAQQSQTKLRNRKDNLLDFRKSALMEYMGMIYYRQDQRWDDWRISLSDLKTASAKTPYYPQVIPQDYIPRKHLAAGKGGINLVVFSGCGVRKYAQAVRLVKAPGGVIVQFDSGADPEAELGFGLIAIPTLSQNFSYYEMKIPVMRKEENLVDRIVVRLDNQEPQELYPLEPFAQINMEIFRRLRSDFLPKQITAFILKVAASEVTQSILNRQGSGATSLIAGLAGSALTSISSPMPDLRTASFYPSMGWVCELQADEGSHEIELRYYSGSSLLNRKFLQISVRAGESQIAQDYYAR